MPSFAQALRYVQQNKRMSLLTLFAVCQLYRWLRGDDEEREAIEAEAKESRKRARQRKRKADLEKMRQRQERDDKHRRQGSFTLEESGNTRGALGDSSTRGYGCDEAADLF